LRHLGRYYVTLLLNRELVGLNTKRNYAWLVILQILSRPKTRNLPKIFLRSFENVAPDVNSSSL